MENIVHRSGAFVRAVLLLSGIVFGLPFSSPAAKPIILAWNASPQTNVVSYGVYCGTASGRYFQKLAVPSTKTTISNLVENTTYYFAVTAPNDLGMESQRSAELA